MSRPQDTSGPLDEDGFSIGYCRGANLAPTSSHAVEAKEPNASAYVLVPRVPNVAMTMAFHNASPHRPTGWTAEEAWSVMVEAALTEETSR